MNQLERRHLIYGIKRSLPIVMGYIPIGFALGVMAADIGLKTVETGLMSFSFMRDLHNLLQ